MNCWWSFRCHYDFLAHNFQKLQPKVADLFFSEKLSNFGNFQQNSNTRPHEIAVQGLKHAWLRFELGPHDTFFLKAYFFPRKNVRAARARGHCFSSILFFSIFLFKSVSPSSSFLFEIAKKAYILKAYNYYSTGPQRWAFTDFFFADISTSGPEHLISVNIKQLLTREQYF